VKLILGWVALTVTVMVAVLVLPGISVDWTAGVYCAIALGLATLNVVLAWALLWLELPLKVLTWGSVALVLNTIAFLATDQVMGSLHVDNIWAALAAGALVALVDLVIEATSRSFRTGLTRSS